MDSVKQKSDKIKAVKPYDLEERTFQFSFDVRQLTKKLKKIIGNIEDGKQVVRSSGSVGANYIEANELIRKKELVLKIKACRKESKESLYWLLLLDLDDQPDLNPTRAALVRKHRNL